MYKKLEIENEQSYGEQYTGNWWKKAKELIPSVAYILSIILYSDAITTDTLGKGSLHPIYIFLGNISTWRRNKEDAKQLLGYLPILSIENEQSYGEQYTGNWWKKAKELIPSVAYILSIILYSDAITTDTLGKGSLHPIYIFLGNISTWRRNKEDAKQLLGYLPILSVKDERKKKSSEFKKLVHETFHNFIKFLLDSLFTNDNDDGDGIELKIDNEIFWFFPRVSTIICDWLEACTFSLTYKSTNSNYSCHFCLVSKENLNNMFKG
ncbi:hypothetical protein Glove_123g179 [Diversispora epigaea]|uniref:Uncharacterized protein n=1 Tax=Diversispora epigaea TaxID=1348612 RepID=A0A397J5B3_9GLOM|nr:hypothetical protein Glove_123g179 [Diversispora epigaea]